MNNARYYLEPYSGINSRFDCPACNKKKCFVRYVDFEKSEYLPTNFGKCNREIKCGYWLDPYKEKFWENENQIGHKEPFKKAIKIQKTEIDFIDFELVLSSIKKLESNCFVRFLNSIFNEEITKEIIKKYFIGSSKLWGNIGATIFWQVDYFGNVRTGKIMAYDSQTGKRIKEPFNHISWVHKFINKPEFGLHQCYFGEHLLRIYPLKKVAIVESEKTAIISSVYFPEFVWLASGSLNNISISKSEHLYNREIILFPDLSSNSKALEIWNAKAIELSQISKSVMVFDLLESIGSKEQKEKGFDLADFLISTPFDSFKRSESKGVRYESFNRYSKGLKFENNILINGSGYPSDWDTISSYKGVDTRTKNFITMVIKNPVLLEFQKRFGLE